ncbi:MAG: hypothetical protein KDD47_11595 [Acidobacteria bacterium]|nr:hypothetical protein [Acidobacteriota bacterium]
MNLPRFLPSFLVLSTILCAIPAVAADDSTFVSQVNIPATIGVGQQATVSITMHNSGTTTWTPAAGYKLGSQNPQDNSTWGFSRVLLSSKDSIPPGGNKTFTFTITAPPIVGSYNFQWRMVHEFVQWFGAFTPNRVIQVVPAVSDDADFVSQSGIPATMNVGEQRTVSITLRNSGVATWTRAGNYKLGSQNPQDNSTWGFSRVLLSSNDSIPPGGTKTFTFTITAPAVAGSYDFQWRMVHEFVQWFGDFTPNRVITVNQPQITLCPGVTADGGFGARADAAIQQCINQTPSGGTFQLPVGTYRIGATVQITKPMTLRTAGTSGQANCEAAGVACAVLKADPSLNVNTGLLRTAGSGVTISHLVVDGNRDARLSGAASAQCQSFNNEAGTNIFYSFCDGCTFTHAVSRETLCGTGLSWVGDGARVTNSVFRNNGRGTVNGLWSDGLTLLRSANAVVTNNLFVNNSDVALVLGGSTNSTVTGNTIQQNDRVVFAGLHVSNFGNNSLGNFTGTTFANNSIDCGNFWCDFGIQLGHHPWTVSANILGGTVRDNSVHNAWQPIDIDGAGTAANPIRVYNNTITGFSVRTVPCGPGQTSAYNINTADSVVDRNGDTTPITQLQWHNCSGPPFRP